MKDKRGKRLVGLCLAILLCLGLCGVGTQLHRTDRDRAHLHGMVRSVTEEEASLSQSFGQTVEGPRHIVSVTYYDAQGWIMEEQEFSDTGSLEKKSVYTYVSAGKRDECREYSSSGWLLGVTRYEYDAAGSPLGYAEYKANGNLDTKAIYHLDGIGNITSVDVYDADGSISTRVLSRFDAAGREVQTSMYGETGGLSVQTTSEYDATGRQTRSAAEFFDDDTGTLQVSAVTTYDEAGNEATYTMELYGLFAALSVATGKPSTTKNIRYDHIIDPQRNWTKKTKLEQVSKFGQTYWEPTETSYRTIVYY